MIQTYDQNALDTISKAGSIACRVLDFVEQNISANVTTLDIDHMCHQKILEMGGYPECIGYQGYKHASCISVNNTVCHGVPNQTFIKDGDLVNVDIVVRYGEWLADTSRTFAIGEITKEDGLLLKLAKNCMYAGLKMCEVGNGFRFIGFGIDRYIKNFNKVHNTNFTTTNQFCSHGIGKCMHENPSISHVRNSSLHIILPFRPFTVEPIIINGSPELYEGGDGWSIYTKSGKKSAQFEHTVSFDAQNKLRILTARDIDHEKQILDEISVLQIS